MKIWTRHALSDEGEWRIVLTADRPPHGGRRIDPGLVLDPKCREAVAERRRRKSRQECPVSQAGGNPPMARRTAGRTAASAGSTFSATASKAAPVSKAASRNFSTSANQASCGSSSGCGIASDFRGSRRPSAGNSRPTPSTDGMNAPVTLSPPQTSAPSQKRQIGARRKTCCHASPRSNRLADRPPSAKARTPRETPWEPRRRQNPAWREASRKGRTT